MKAIMMRLIAKMNPTMLKHDVPINSKNESTENLSVPLHVQSYNDDRNDVNILNVTERARQLLS
jgi:hypothetical protein